jgi:subtilisin family serine protease
MTEKQNNKKGDIFLYPYTVEHVMSTLSQSQGWHVKQLNVPETWKVTRGEGIKVLVIDTGFTSHPDLAGGMNLKASKSFLHYERAKGDKNGHSTHVCGIIGARDNAQGCVGVAPDCEIITAKVLGEDGAGSFTAIRQSLEYALRIKPDVINMSLGSHAYDSKMHDLIKKLHKENIPVIAAAGNDGRGNAVNYPAKYPEVICVTAYDKKGRPARFNSTGKEADFSAPGVDIYSTYLKNGYAKLNGTSMATPFVAGLVALLIAKHRKQEAETGENDCQTVDQIKQHLIKYADDKGVVGRDETWGYGVIDPVKAIMAAEGTLPEEPEEVEDEKPRQGILSWLIGKLKNLFRF